MLAGALEGAFGPGPRVERATARDKGDLWAASGAMWLTGRSDGPPLSAPGAPAEFLAAALRLLSELADGTPFPGTELLGERAAVLGLARQGPRSAGGHFRLVRTNDGWLGLTLSRPWDFAALPALIEEDVDEPWPTVERWAQHMPARAASSRAQLLGIAATAVPSTAIRPANLFSVERHGRRRPRRQPLVIDLSALWAGPLCANLLSHAGARVVKVESTTRPDAMRSGAPRFFDLLNERSESVALDVDVERGAESLRRLVRRADVVIESSRPRALDQLGIDRRDAVAHGATWVSISAYGQAGERPNDVGFGDDVAAGAGLVAWDEADDFPVPCADAIADPLTGAVAAVAALAALHAGGGFLIDLSMHDVAAWAATFPREPRPPADPVPPRARVSGPAAPFGRHTRTVLTELT
jgi:CoA-transferase family III